LAVKHGFYNEPKAITMQALADILGIARSTYQEHLQSAEQAVLVWAGSQL
jgi:predicted DNA binding protein